MAELEQHSDKFRFLTREALKFQGITGFHLQQPDRPRMVISTRDINTVISNPDRQNVIFYLSSEKSLKRMRFDLTKTDVTLIHGQSTQPKVIKQALSVYQEYLQVTGDL